MNFNSQIDNDTTTTTTTRVILLIDMDCFYFQVLLRDDDSLRNKPVVVKQKYIIATCNYEARRLGINKIQSLNDVLENYPQVTIVDGSDLLPFRKASKEINKLLKEYFSQYPDLEIPIQKVGFDESFIDVTSLCKLILKNNPNYKDFSGCIYNSGSKHSNQLLAIGSNIANKLRHLIKEKLNFESCAGISTNKLSAKLASDLNKPFNQTIVFPEDIFKLVSESSVRKISGIGRATLKKLNYPKTGEEVQQISMEELKSNLRNDKEALKVYNLCRGIDNEDVKNSSFQKQISQYENSLPHPHTYQQMLNRLVVLIDKLLPLLLERKDESNEVPMTLSIGMLIKPRYAKIKRSQRTASTKQIPVHNDMMECVTDIEIKRRMYSLLEKVSLSLLKNSEFEKEFRISNMVITASNFQTKGDLKQQELDDFLNLQQEKTSSCPICNKFIQTTEINQHIDTCLNSNTIKHMIKSEQQLSSRKKKKVKIEDYFKS